MCRYFLAYLLAALVPSVQADPPQDQRDAGDLDPTLETFRDPPSSARPYVRWWWNGNKVTRREILRELDLLKEAGIGGIEINPIRFPTADEPAGHRSLEWLSGEWCEMVNVATAGARDRGMQADIIVGSGWPFGGDFLPREHQTKILTVGRKRVRGPKTITIDRQEMLDTVNLPLHSKHEKVFQSVRHVRLTPAELNQFDPGTDLTDKLVGDTLTIEVPPGDHIVHFFVVQEGFQAVINGAPGSDGPVLNHFSREAVEYYLNHMSKGMSPALGKLGDHFRAFFCDSLELEGANWNDDLLAEFERRRGYDLLPWLPYLMKKTGHMGNEVTSGDVVRLSPELSDQVGRVRYDYWVTLIELFRERFLEPFINWCHAQGALARVQAYGRCYDPLESSMLVDIPECETWLSEQTGRRGSPGAYSMNNKFTASGARLAGKQLVSCEEITNTNCVFFASLEQIKVAGDESNLSGVTHSILHGFNYSPPEAGFPGWVRYGTYFSEQNTWWPYVRRWTDYKARLSWLLQQAVPEARIAILHPLADLWTRHGMQRDPFPSVRQPAYAHQLWRAVQCNGFNCDYTTERILCRSAMESGFAVFGRCRYDTLILMEVDTVTPETAAALEEFATSGGRLVFLGRAPSRAPGLAAAGEGDRLVSAAMERVLMEFPDNCRVVRPPDQGADLTHWFEGVRRRCGMQPDVEFDDVNQTLGQAHYRLEDREVFFFINSDRDRSVSTRAAFQTGAATPWVWDLETGERRVHPWLSAPDELQIDLGPAESMVLVFEGGSGPEPPAAVEPSALGAAPIRGVWSVALDHVDGSEQTLELQELTNLGSISGLEGFAGRATYTTEFTTLGGGEVRFLDLGKVRDISDVTIDGKPLGCRWYGRHRYRLPAELPAGAHRLRVTVTTVLGNYCKALVNNSVAQAWTSHQSTRPMGLLGPVSLMEVQSARYRKSTSTSLSGGL